MSISGLAASTAPKRVAAPDGTGPRERATLAREAIVHASVPQVSCNALDRRCTSSYSGCSIAPFRISKGTEVHFRYTEE